MSEHREQLVIKLDEVRKQKELEKAGCDHLFKRYMQTLPYRDRTVQQVSMGMEYKFGRAYFIIIACDKCKEKRLHDYVIER